MELGNIIDGERTWPVKFGEDGEVEMRYVPKAELVAIRKKATKTDWSAHRPVETLDEMEQNRLLGRAAVRGWKNLTVGGEPFPYSPENCDMLMARSYDFSDFVNLVCTRIGFFREQKEEESKKKSAPTPDGPDGTPKDGASSAGR